MPRLTATHWGVYEVAAGPDGRPALRPFADDPDPSPIGLDALGDEVARLRVKRPAVRAGWLDGDPATRGGGRGREPFVEIGWDEALDLVAGELARVRGDHGNAAIFGGSYGWSSAGRFHHAQSQVHRFLNAIGGYVRSVDTYSLGAARVLMPHIVAPMEELMVSHTAWDVVAEHTKLFVCFGGIPAKNAQVSSGGAMEHRVPGALRRAAGAGVRFVNVSPVADDIDTGAPVEWIPIRPNTDAALMLALAHTLYVENRHDGGFLARCCTGFERFVPYLTGTADGQPKDAAWAAAITEVPAARIVALAREMAGTRTMLNASWSLQRAQYGEQPYWALVTLASMLGQIGLPGGGFGVGYGATNLMGSPNPRFPGPTLPQGRNDVAAFIPVARIADMLRAPGSAFDYNGGRHVYPDIRLIYWAGGNPFHHHQDLNRFVEAWRRPETVVVHEQFWTASARLADIVLPATTAHERDDICFANGERHLVAMKAAVPPHGEARDDYAIFAALAGRLGAADRYTENRGASEWLRVLYEDARTRAARAGAELPGFDAFWQDGIVSVAPRNSRPVMLDAFRADPAAHPLKTPSGRIEIFSERIAGFGYEDCPGHAVWRAPDEFLGTATARHPLHMLSDQPSTRLHSQLDHSAHSRAGKVAGRQPITLNPHDAAARGIAAGDVVRVYNDRGACLAGAVVSEAVRRGVVRLSTGAWFDPAPEGAPERAGNPNVLTRDVGTSRLAQGCSAQSCLVEVERWTGPVPLPSVYSPPRFAARRR